MLKQLKRKFIWISMLSVTLVLTLIMGTINIINYHTTKQSAEHLLNILADNDGIFPKRTAGTKPEAEAPEAKQPPVMDSFSPEAPFNTRYFTVTLSIQNGQATVTDTNTSNIAAVSSELAHEYAFRLNENTRRSGYQDNYRYRRVMLSDTSVMYIFLDCEQELQSFRSFLTASLTISLSGLLLIFFLLLVSSGYVVRPIAESYEKQKRFITDASHEIKTPLAIIDANTDVIEMEHGSSPWTSSNKKQIERLTALTEKLVLLSKMDEPSAEMDMQPLNLSELLTDTIDSFEAVCNTRSILLTTSVEPDVTIVGNTDALRQAFTMLIDNALKYSDGSIHISLKRKNRRAFVIFANSVAKIQPGIHNEFFERFYRPDTSRNTRTGGFGIGLSTVKAITEAHKGRINAKSQNDHSIQFSLLLPLCLDKNENTKG